MAIANNKDLTHVVRTTQQWQSSYDKYECIPEGVLCIEFTTSGQALAKIGNGRDIFSKLPYIGGTDLTNYYTKSETAKCIEEIIKANRFIRIKGILQNKDQLPSHAECGDLYFVISQNQSSSNKYDEYVYSPGNTWENLGSIPIDIDLSEYAKIVYVDEKIDEVNERIDDIEQHGTHTHANKDILDLITAAFTAEEKDKLSTLYNYDDSELRELITQASHTHSNKDILDAISAPFTKEDKSKLDQLNPYDDSILKEKITALERLAHEHSNKRILDRTTASFTTEYERKMRWIRLYTGCTGMEEGIAGLVPAAQAGEEDYVLSGSGEWVPQTGGGGTYELPIATASTLGGIKVGDGLDIDANGKLSVVGGGGGDSIAEGDGITITTDPQTGVKTISVNAGDHLEVDENTGELNVTDVDYEAGQGIHIGADYTLIEYIKNSGNYDQIIITDIIPVFSDKIELDIKFGAATVETVSDDKFFGCYNNSSTSYSYYGSLYLSSNSYANIGIYNHFKYESGNTGDNFFTYPDGVSYTGTSSVRHTLTVQGATAKWNNSIRNFSSYYNQSFSDPQIGIAIFGMNKVSGDADCFSQCNLTVYGVKLYDSNNTLLHDLRPAERGADGEAGLYDLVTHRFYGNAGNGSFVKGPPVSSVDDRLISAKIGNGLQFDSNNAIEVNIGNGLEIDPQTGAINVTESGDTVEAGNGIDITTDSQTGNKVISVDTGNGLQINQDSELEIDPSVLPSVTEYHPGRAIEFEHNSSHLSLTAFSNTDFIASITRANAGNFVKAADNSTITLTASGTDCYTIGIGGDNSASGSYAYNVKANTQYRLMWDSSDTTIPGNIMVFENAGYTNVYVGDQSITSFIDFTTSSTCTFITTRLGVSNAGDSVIFSNVRLYEYVEDTFEYDDISVKYDNGLTVNSDNELEVVLSKGLEFNPNTTETMIADEMYLFESRVECQVHTDTPYSGRPNDRVHQKTTTEPALCCLWEVADSGYLWTGPLFVGLTSTSVQYTTQDTHQTVNYQNTFTYLDKTWYTSGYPDFLNDADHEDKLGHVQYLGSYASISAQIQAAKDLIDLANVRFVSNAGIQAKLGNGLSFDNNGAIEAPVMGASGTNHSSGLVPDPGSTAGTTKFLREDGTWVEPESGGETYEAGNGIEITEVTHEDEFRVQNQEYFFTDHGLTCIITGNYGPRTYTKINDGDIVAAVIGKTGGWYMPLFVGLTEDSVKYSNSYDSNILGPTGSFTYHDKTWYYTADYALTAGDGVDHAGHLQSLSTIYTAGEEGDIQAAKDLIDLAVLLPDVSTTTISAKIGNGLSFDANGAIRADAQPLSPATDSTLGGVIVGDGILVDNDGTISVDPTIIPEIPTYEAGTAISIEDVEHGGVTFDAWNSGTGWENVCYQASTGNAVVTYTYEAHSPISNSYTLPAGATHIRAIAYDQNDNLLWTSFSWIDSNDYHFASTSPDVFDNWFEIPTGAVKVNFGVRHSKLNNTTAMNLNDIKSVDITIQTASEIEVDVWNGGSGWLNGNYYTGTSDTFTTSWYYSYHSNPDAYIPIPNGATHLMVMGISNENDSHFEGGGVNVFSAESHSNHIAWWGCAWEWHEISSDAKFVQIDVKWNDNNTRTISGSDIKSITLVWKLPALEINQAINVKYGDGLTVNQNNELEVDLGSGLQFDANGAIEVTGGTGGDTIVEGDGIEITTDQQTGVKTIGVNVGNGLEIDPVTGALGVAPGVSGNYSAGEAIGFETVTDTHDIVWNMLQMSHTWVNKAYTAHVGGNFTNDSLCVHSDITPISNLFSIPQTSAIYTIEARDQNDNLLHCIVDYHDGAGNHLNWNGEFISDPTKQYASLSSAVYISVGVVNTDHSTPLAISNVKSVTLTWKNITETSTEISVKYGTGLSVDPITNELFVDGQLPEGTIIKKLTYVGDGGANTTIQFDKKPLAIITLYGQAVNNKCSAVPTVIDADVLMSLYGTGSTSQSDKGGTVCCEMSYDDSTNILTLSKGYDTGARYNISGETYQMYYLTKGHVGSGTSVNNEVSVIKTIAYTGTGTATNTIQFPETPDFILSINGKDGVSGDMVVFSFDNLHPSDAHQYIYTFCYNAGISSNYFAGGHGTFDFNPTTNVLTLTGADQGAACNYLDRVYYLRYVVNEVIASSNYVEGDGIEIDPVTGEISVNIGSGLAFDPQTGAINVTGGGGGSGDTVAEGTGIEITTDQQTGNKVIAVNAGTGLQVDQTTNELEIDDSVVTEDDELTLVFVPDDYQPS